MPSSTGYADTKMIKQNLLIADTQTNADDKIKRYAREADDFVNTQMGLHANIPITAVDSELVSLASGVAAALYNYWNSPDQTMEGVKAYKKDITDHIKANFYRANVDGMTVDTVTKTASRILGTDE